jgi:hypothetical protein
MIDPVSRSILHPLVALALVVLWISPGAYAVALGLHVAFDHHASGNEDHDLTELAQDAVHGHHHDDVAAASAHEHPATAHGPTAPCRLSLSPLGATLFTMVSTDALIKGSRASAGIAWRGPPPALFTTHCSLLI